MRLVGNKNGLPEFEEAGLSHKANINLVFVVAQKSTLLEILTANTVSRPRHCFQSFVRQRFAAMNALAITRGFDSLECFVDQIEQLAIVVGHRHQQFFGIRVGSHIGRILCGFSVTFATVKLRGLNLADESFATIQ
jgi:hypothetical protein